MKKFGKMTDEEAAAIHAGIAADPDTWVADASAFKQARRGRPVLSPNKKKQRVTMLLDPDVLAHFKQSGRGWQTRINEALKQVAGITERPSARD